MIEKIININMGRTPKIPIGQAQREKEAKAKLREKERLAKAKAQLAKLKQDARDVAAKVAKETSEKKAQVDQAALAKIAKKRKTYDKRVGALKEKISKIPKVSRSFTEDELVAAAIAKFDQKQERARKEMIKTIEQLRGAPRVKPEFFVKPEPIVPRSTAGCGVIDLTD